MASPKALFSDLREDQRQQSQNQLSAVILPIITHEKAFPFRILQKCIDFVQCFVTMIIIDCFFVFFPPEKHNDIYFWRVRKSQDSPAARRIQSLQNTNLI